MSAEFQLWIESEDCYRCLLVCSPELLVKATNKGICLEEVFRDAQSGDKSELEQVIAQEMWLFLKNSGNTIAKRHADLLLQNNKDQFIEVIISAFLNHCKDKRRTYGVDPVYAYYRGLRTDLSKSKAVNFKAVGRQGSFYALCFDADLNLLPYNLWGQPYQGWTQPDLTSEKIYTAVARVHLANHFWAEALVNFEKEFFLPIKELLTFVLAHYQIGCSVEGVSNSGILNPDNQLDRSDDEILSTSASPRATSGPLTKYKMFKVETDIIERDLERLSQDCVATFSQLEKSLLMKIEEGMKLADIATSLGMKSPSNVKYHQKNAYEKLKRMWSLWCPTGEASDEVAEEEFWIFYDKVIEFCKKDSDCRKS